MAMAPARHSAAEAQEQYKSMLPKHHGRKNCTAMKTANQLKLRLEHPIGSE
jgi:hypothetical protein